MCIADLTDAANNTPAPPRVLTPRERLEALLAAEMNDDRAALCTRDQPALRKVFEMNAALFRKLAQ